MPKPLDHFIGGNTLSSIRALEDYADLDRLVATGGEQTQPGAYDGAAEVVETPVEEIRAERTRHERASSFALDTPEGQRSFRAAWLAAGSIGWLLGLTFAAIAFWQLLNDDGPLWRFGSEFIITALAVVFLASLISLPLQLLLLRHFVSLRGLRSWMLANLTASLVLLAALVVFVIVSSAVLLVLAMGFTGKGDDELLNSIWQICILVVFVGFASLFFSPLQEGMCLRPRAGRSTGWILPTSLGRLLGMGAGIALVWLIIQQTMAPWAAYFLNHSTLTVVLMWGTVWALISGSIAAPAMLRAVLRIQEHQMAGEKGGVPRGYDPLLQTWLPRALLLAVLLAAAAWTGRMAALPEVLYPSYSLIPSGRRVALAPDGKTLVTGGNYSTAVRASTSGEPLVMISVGRTDSAVFSPDGKQIVSAGGDGIRIWDVASGQQLRQLIIGNKRYDHSAMYSPDGRQIVTASGEGTARIWDAATGQELRRFVGHTGSVNSAVFSPDGMQIVTAGKDKTARVWNVATGLELRVLTGHSEAVNSAVFSPDGKQIVTASRDNTARIWDVASGQELLLLTGPRYGFNSAAFSPDGQQVVTANADDTARIWDVATGQEIRVLAGHSRSVNSAVFSPDGRQILTASDDGTACVWDTETLKREVLDHPAVVTSAAYSPDGTRIITTSLDREARIWDAATGKTLHRLFFGHKITDIIRTATFSPDGQQVVTASADDTARIWDVASGRELYQFTAHTGEVNSAAYSPDGKQIVTANGNKTARIWDVATEKELRVLTGHSQNVYSAVFSPDGQQVVTASADQTARIWDVATGEELHRLTGHTSAVNSAAFSPDGTRIATASQDRTARTWDAVTGRELLRLAGHGCDLEDSDNCGVTSASYSPDGTLIVTTGYDGVARIWDATDGTTTHILHGDSGPLYNAVFSPDGQQVFVSAGPGLPDLYRVQVYDLSGKRTRPAQSSMSSEPP